MSGGRLEAGDTIRCETCRRECLVRSYEWEAPVQVIFCHEGMRVVGVDHEPVTQHLVVDYRRLAELV